MALLAEILQVTFDATTVKNWNLGLARTITPSAFLGGADVSADRDVQGDIAELSVVSEASRCCGYEFPCVCARRVGRRAP